MVVLQTAAALPPQVMIAKTANIACLLIPCKTCGVRWKSELDIKPCGSERSLKRRFRGVLKPYWDGREVAGSRLGTFKGVGGSEGRSIAALGTAELPLECEEALVAAPSKEDVLRVRARRSNKRFTDIQLFLKSFSNVAVEDCVVNVDKFRVRQLQKAENSDMSMLAGNGSVVTSPFRIENVLVDSSTLTGIKEPQVDPYGCELKGNPTNNAKLNNGQSGPLYVASREKATPVVASAKRKERQLKRLRAQKIREKGWKVSSMMSVQRKKTSTAERDEENNARTTLHHESTKMSSKFLPHIRKRDLLTAEDEVKLALQVRDLVKIEKVKSSLVVRLGREPTLGEWSNVLGMKLAIFQKRLWAARKANIRMINSNLPLVVSIAKDYQGQGVPFQDLLQEGTIGLMQAVESFDPSLGYRFSTYAHWRIKKAVTLAAARQSKSTRIPMNAVEAMHRANEASMSFLEKHGRPAMENEIAQLAKISVLRLRTIRNALGSTKSFEGSPGRDEAINFTETIADESSANPKGIEFRNSFKYYLEEAFDCLSDREKEVLRLRFGVDSGKMLTLEEVGENLHLTRERVRQIEQKAMVKLKNSCKTKLLKTCVHHIEP